MRRIQADSPEWDEIVRSMIGYSVYQSAAYHRMAQQMDGGVAQLFFFEEGDRQIAVPLIIREIDSRDDLIGTNLRDATSVYGYPGILANIDNASAGLIEKFQHAFHAEMEAANVVTVFLRLRPFHTGVQWIDGLGNVEKMGDTVAIDLTNSDETRFRSYRRNHRSNIKQLRALGASTTADNSDAAIERFASMYQGSMRRVAASDWFMFGRSYFQQLCTEHPDETVLMETTVAGELTCGGLFLSSGDVAYAHLTATTDAWAGRSPTKALFDDAATYFRAAGCRWLHIGGGLGARDDSLYRFKRGFSQTTFPFHVWKYVVDMKSYQALCRENAVQTFGEKYEAYFPQYRAKLTS